MKNKKFLHISYAPGKNCKHKGEYVMCVKCNDCGRFGRNLDKEVVLHYGKRWLGTVQYFVDMPEEEWERLRYEILLEVSEIEIIGADHQYSKLAFTSHIDKLKGIKRGKED